MPIYSISPIVKKSVIDVETYSKEIAGHRVYLKIETGWRWGEVQVEADSGLMNDLDVNNAEGFRPYECDGLEVIDCSASDACWEEWIFPDGFPEDEKKQLMELCEDEGKWMLEEQGWCSDETETTYTGSLRIVDEDGNVVAEGRVEEGFPIQAS